MVAAQKKPDSIALAVGSAHGPRSSSWIVNLDDKDEMVMVSHARVKNEFAFHWHVPEAYHVKQLKSGALMSMPGWTGDPLYPIKARFRENELPDIMIALAIMIPESCLRKASNPDRQTKVDIWLPRPPTGGCTEIAIVASRYRVTPEEFFAIWNSSKGTGSTSPPISAIQVGSLGVLALVAETAFCK